MRTLLKLLQHNIWYKVIVSLKKWHYEKKIYILLFLSSIHNFFFLRFTFLKTNSYRVKTKKMKKKKLLPRFHFFLFSKKKQSSFNKNSRNIILKKSKERQRRISKKTRWIRWWKKNQKGQERKNAAIYRPVKQNKDYLKKECVSILQIL